MTNVQRTLGVLLMSFLLPTIASAEEPRERFYIVNDYRYTAPDGGSEDALVLGQSLCGSRCNALSSDYRNYTESGAWRMIRIAKDKEVSIDFGNLKVPGTCICVADEFIVVADELNNRQPGFTPSTPVRK